MAPFVTRRLVLLAILSAAAGSASAAAIYGNLRRGNQPLEAPLKLICGGETVLGQSDKAGNYNLSIAASGRCALSVGDRSVLVVLGKDPARYDFDVPADPAAPLSQR